MTGAHTALSKVDGVATTLKLMVIDRWVDSQRAGRWVDSQFFVERRVHNGSCEPDAASVDDSAKATTPSVSNLSTVPLRPGGSHNLACLQFACRNPRTTTAAANTQHEGLSTSRTSHRGKSLWLAVSRPFAWYPRGMCTCTGKKDGDKSQAPPNKTLAGELSKHQFFAALLCANFMSPASRVHHMRAQKTVSFSQAHA